MPADLTHFPEQPVHSGSISGPPTPRVDLASVRFGRLAWFVPLAVFLAFAGYLLVAQRTLLFGPFLIPVGDHAADDLLIFDATRLHLLHGNYSRVGFYHPGPWFQYVAAAGELVFYRWTGLFSSYAAGQTFALSLLYGIGFAFVCRLWLLVTERVSLALLAVLIVAASILAPWRVMNPFIEFWNPHFYIGAAMLAATGLAGLLLRGPSWMPLLALGCAELVHGHASFLGIVPMVLGVATLCAFGLGRLPFDPWDLHGARDWAWRNRGPVGISLGIATLFLVPIALHTLRHWPGQLGAYLAFSNSAQPQPLGAALRYVAVFVPAFGVWMLLFLLPSGTHRGPASPYSGRTDVLARDLRATGLTVFCSAMLPAIYYIWRKADYLQFQNPYLLLWLSPIIGVIAVAAVFYAVCSSWVPPSAKVALCLFAAAWSINAVRLAPTLNFDKPGATSADLDVAGNLDVQRGIAALIAEANPAGRTELVFHPYTPDDNNRQWAETAAALAVMKRAGRNDFCIAPANWHVLFTERYRCEPNETIVRRLRVTMADHTPRPLLIRFDLVGIEVPLQPTVGKATSVPAAVDAGLDLDSGWSSIEPGGVWTDGTVARLSFDTGALPVHFRLSLVGQLTTPRGTDQVVHIRDSTGRELAVLQGKDGPVSVALDLDRNASISRFVLTFEVEHPVVPAERDGSLDRRHLGFGLSQVAFEPVLQPKVGEAMNVPAALDAGFDLVNGWSGLESWGVWTDGPVARLSFDTGALPAHYRLTLGGQLAAPREKEQIVHIRDSTGRELGVLQGKGGPASITLDLDRSIGISRLNLTLEVEHPVVPAELGTNSDLRHLGFGLSEVRLSR